jgi:hypothetical protein
VPVRSQLIIGVVVIFPMIASSIEWVSKPLFSYTRRLVDNAVERVFPRKLVDIDGDGDPDFEVPRHPLVYYGRNMLAPVLIFLTLQFLFSAIFISVESWSYSVALYHCIITATTVGYGDISIETDAGRGVAIAHILVSVSLLAAIVADIDSLREERRKNLLRGKQFVERVNVDNILSLDQDGQGVDRFEFVVGMLIRLEMVPVEEVAAFKAQFDVLDASGDGIITRKELEEYARKMQEFANSSPEIANVISNIKRRMDDEAGSETVLVATQHGDVTELTEEIVVSPAAQEKQRKLRNVNLKELGSSLSSRALSLTSPRKSAEDRTSRPRQHSAPSAPASVQLADVDLDLSPGSGKRSPYESATEGSQPRAPPASLVAAAQGGSARALAKLQRLQSNEGASGASP